MSLILVAHWCYTPSSPIVSIKYMVSTSLYPIRNPSPPSTRHPPIVRKTNNNQSFVVAKASLLFDKCTHSRGFTISLSRSNSSRMSYIRRDEIYASLPSRYFVLQPWYNIFPSTDDDDDAASSCLHFRRCNHDAKWQQSYICFFSGQYRIMWIWQYVSMASLDIFFCTIYYTGNMADTTFCVERYYGKEDK
jgi:hypothetical protein